MELRLTYAHKTLKPGKAASVGVVYATNFGDATLEPRSSISNALLVIFFFLFFPSCEWEGVCLSWSPYVGLASVSILSLGYPDLSFSASAVENYVGLF